MVYFGASFLSRRMIARGPLVFPTPLEVGPGRLAKILAGRLVRDSIKSAFPQDARRSYPL